MTPPRLGITVGDPGGIGPEIVLKALLQRESDLSIIVYGPKALTEHAMLAPLFSQLQFTFGFPDKSDLGLHWVDIPGGFDVGRPSSRNGQLSLSAIQAAAHAATSGLIHGIVTAPISKTSLAATGAPAFDHTTLLQQMTHSPTVRMCFVSPTLKVLLHSIHIPLCEVVSTLTPRHLHDTFAMAQLMISQLNIPSPKIAIAGLNPHAGEDGLMGVEEQKILSPVLEAWNQKASVPILGPFPGDTVFLRAHQGEFDLVIALYHDQGLIPVKILHFDTAVNMTLGLPFVRTSPDHGTAFDIAYSLKANPASMLSALTLAERLVLQ